MKLSSSVPEDETGVDAARINTLSDSDVLEADVMNSVGEASLQTSAGAEGVKSFGRETQALSPDRIMTGLVVSMCVLGAVFYCYEYFLRVAPSVMAFELKSAFSLSDAAFGNLAACYYYAYTPMQIPVGMMMDKYGPRRILTFACLCCVLGTYLFAVTSNVLLAQIGRFLVGFGSAFAYVGILKISDIWLPRKYFVLMAGLASALGMAGAIIGQITMAFMVKSMGWQVTMQYSAYAGIFLMFALLLVLRDEVPQDGKNRLKAESSISELKVIAGLIEIIKNRAMWMNGVIGCLTFLPLSAFGELWAVPFLETVGFTKAEAALGSSMVSLGFAIGGPCFGIYSEYIKSRRIPLAIGSFISAFFMFLAIAMPSLSKLWMFSLLFLSGFFAAAEILVFAIGNDLSRKEVTATAAAFTNMMVMVSGVIIPPVIGKLLDNSHRIGVDGQLSSIAVHDYTIALMILPVALVLAGFLSIHLKETYKSH